MKIGFIGLGNMGGSLARVVARQKKTSNPARKSKLRKSKADCE